MEQTLGRLLTIRKVAMIKISPKRLIWFTSSLIVIFFASILTIGHYLSLPAQSKVGEPPKLLKAIDVEYKGVTGWFSKGDKKDKCVLLMHGVKSNRLSMVDRALLFNKHGYSVMLIDLQAHGQTSGDFISFGYLESTSARNAVSFLRKVKSCEKIASIGISLGGAASLLGSKPLDVDAMVLESVYSKIELAVENRVNMRLGDTAKLLAPFLYYQLPLKHGISLESLSPIDSIKKVTSPLLIIAGSEDKHTTIQESKALFNAAPSPKLFWEIKGAAHVDFYEFAKEEYSEILLNFLDMNLKSN